MCPHVHHSRLTLWMGKDFPHPRVGHRKQAWVQGPTWCLKDVYTRRAGNIHTNPPHTQKGVRPSQGEEAEVRESLIPKPQARRACQG